MIGLMMFQGKRCLELVPSLAASHLKHEDPTLATELLRLLLHVENRTEDQEFPALKRKAVEAVVVPVLDSVFFLEAVVCADDEGRGGGGEGDVLDVSYSWSSDVVVVSSEVCIACNHQKNVKRVAGYPLFELQVAAAQVHSLHFTG